MIPIQITYSLVALFYIVSILIHVLVLSKRISFESVNGGRSKDYEQQQKQSQASILILVLMLFFVLSTAIFPSVRSTIVFLVITSLLILFWLFGTVLQLLGTTFERKVVVWINLLGLLSHALLLITYFE